MNAKRALNPRRLLMPTGVALTLVAMAFAGCMESINDGDSAGTGSVSFYVKDAPADELESLFVTFSKVEVKKAGSEGADDESDPGLEESSLESTDDNSSLEDDNSTVDDGNSTVEDDNSTNEDDNSTLQQDDSAIETAGDESSSSGAGWFTVVDSEQTVDLKAFSGDAKAFLGNEDVPAGKYTQIRINVTEAYGILAEDGSRVNVTVPGGALKIVRPWTVEDGAETVLIVDFDLAKSVLKLGNGDWHFKPVMKLMIEKGDQTGEGGADLRGRDGASSGPPEGVGNSTSKGNSTNGKPDDAGPGGHGANSSQTSQGKKNETEAIA